MTLSTALAGAADGDQTRATGGDRGLDRATATGWSRRYGDGRGERARPPALLHREGTARRDAPGSAPLSPTPLVATPAAWQWRTSTATVVLTSPRPTAEATVWTCSWAAATGYSGAENLRRRPRSLHRGGGGRRPRWQA